MSTPRRPTAPEEIDGTFAPAVLAADLREVRRIYERFLDSVDPAAWDAPARRGRQEWTLHETIAHLCALNGAGLDSVVHALRSEPYTFVGLDTRYHLDAYNRAGIDAHLGLPLDALCAEFLGVHTRAAELASTLTADHAAVAADMPIYNRPLTVVEALAIIVMHTGLIHTAQVADPAGVLPLWTQLRPEVRHRQIGRVVRAFSVLYRRDIGGSLRATFAFRVGGPGGGDWYLDIGPDSTSSGEGRPESPKLTLRFRETDDFCRMITGRMNLPLALITGRLRLRGDLRLFVQLSRLVSVDAAP